MWKIDRLWVLRGALEGKENENDGDDDAQKGFGDMQDEDSLSEPIHLG